MVARTSITGPLLLPGTESRRIKPMAGLWLLPCWEDAGRTSLQPLEGAPAFPDTQAPASLPLRTCRTPDSQTRDPDPEPSDPTTAQGGVAGGRGLASVLPHFAPPGQASDLQLRTWPESSSPLESTTGPLFLLILCILTCHSCVTNQDRPRPSSSLDASSPGLLTARRPI